MIGPLENYVTRLLVRLNDESYQKAVSSEQGQQVPVKRVSKASFLWGFRRTKPYRAFETVRIEKLRNVEGGGQSLRQI